MLAASFIPCHQSLSPRPAGHCFAVIGKEVLLLASGDLPGEAELQAFGPARERLIFGHLDGVPCELRLWPDGPLPEGFMPAEFRRLWGEWSEAALDALNRARQLAAWLQNNRYCGVCGHPLQTAAREPARECSACGHKAYPRISPVCIGLVVRGDELLLGRSPHFPPGIYSALAGFLEAGESAEACLRREIREEAGIEIERLRWFGSQAWPYPDSLMLGFFADYAGGQLRAQEEELEDLQWFHRDALPRLPHPSTLAHWMIQAWLEGRIA